MDTYVYETVNQNISTNNKLQIYWELIVYFKKGFYSVLESFDKLINWHGSFFQALIRNIMLNYK